jgi:hypothetical protein
MSAPQHTMPDAAAMANVLSEAAELCRRLDLTNQAALFEGFVDRLRKAQPPFDALRDDAYQALNGPAGLFIWTKLQNDPSEYNRLQLAFGRAAFPQTRKQAKPKRSKDWKAVRDSENVWELGGESDLRAITIPHPPRAHAATTFRLTHSNTYGPFDKAEFFVRVGDIYRPSAPDDLASATGWVRAALIEELMLLNGEEVPRSKAQEQFGEETPWWGTYEAQFDLPAGRQRIEIKVVSHHPEQLNSVVLSDWEVNVRK